MITEDAMIDREYDREVAHRRAVARLSGGHTYMPVFVTPLAAVEQLVEEGRAEYGHPSTWEDAGEVGHLPATAEESVPLCSRWLHEMSGTNVRDGRCHKCQLVRQKRRRYERKGQPLCWRAKHPEPEPGNLCPCGEMPPEETYVDWVMVENAIARREVPRLLTNAEKVSALVTVSVRWGGGLWDAAEWLRLHTDVCMSVEHVHYLIGKWQPSSGVKMLTADEVFMYDMEQVL